MEVRNLSLSSTDQIRFDGLPFTFGKVLTRAEQATCLDGYVDSILPCMPKLVKHRLLDHYDTAHGGKTARKIGDYNPEIVAGKSGFSGSTKFIGRWEAHGLDSRVHYHIDGVQTAFRRYTLLCYGITKGSEWIIGYYDFEERVDRKPLADGLPRRLLRIRLTKPQGTEEFLEMIDRDASSVIACLFLPWIGGRVALVKRELEDIREVKRLSKNCFDVLHGFQGTGGVRRKVNSVTVYEL